MNFNWEGVIQHESVVHVTASEYKGFEGRPPFSTESAPRHLGDAVIRVANIAPHVGGVSFMLIVDWDHWLPVVTDITVFDEMPQIHYTDDANRVLDER
jgi:hypothetical protein